MPLLLLLLMMMLILLLLLLLMLLLLMLLLLLMIMMMMMMRMMMMVIMMMMLVMVMMMMMMTVTTSRLNEVIDKAPVISSFCLHLRFFQALFRDEVTLITSPSINSLWTKWNEMISLTLSSFARVNLSFVRSLFTFI